MISQGLSGPVAEILPSIIVWLHACMCRYIQVCSCKERYSTELLQVSELVSPPNADIINYIVSTKHVLPFGLCYTETYFSHDVCLTSDMSYNITKGI